MKADVSVWIGEAQHVVRHEFTVLIKNARSVATGDEGVAMTGCACVKGAIKSDAYVIVIESAVPGGTLKSALSQASPLPSIFVLLSRVSQCRAVVFIIGNPVAV